MGKSANSTPADTNGFAAAMRGRVFAIDDFHPRTRPRSLHWLARIAALVSLFAAGIWRWATPADPGLAAILVTVDVGLCLFFAAEFFTRSGWKQSGLQYAKWRWFDVLAVIPITSVGPLAITALFWIVLACRALRLVDRSLGDGYLTRTSLALLGRIEEETSDRVLNKMVSRWERKLLDADFGAALADALRRNKDAVLQRVFAQQLNKGAFAKVAHLTGLKAGLEKEETRLFNALIEIVGSPEVDAAIRDALRSSSLRARQALPTRNPRPDPAPTTTPRPAPRGFGLGAAPIRRPSVRPVQSR